MIHRFTLLFERIWRKKSGHTKKVCPRMSASKIRVAGKAQAVFLFLATSSGVAYEQVSQAWPISREHIMQAESSLSTLTRPPQWLHLGCDFLAFTTFEGTRFLLIRSLFRAIFTIISIPMSFKRSVELPPQPKQLFWRVKALMLEIPKSFRNLVCGWSEPGHHTVVDGFNPLLVEQHFHQFHGKFHGGSGASAGENIAVRHDPVF